MDLSPDVPTLPQGAAFQLAQRAQEVGLVVTCLRALLGSGGRAFEVELWTEHSDLWARSTWATADLVREMIGMYAEQCVRGDVGGRREGRAA